MAVQEGHFWALYYDLEGDLLRSKGLPEDTPVLEVELRRIEMRTPKPKMPPPTPAGESEGQPKEDMEKQEKESGDSSTHANGDAHGNANGEGNGDIRGETHENTNGDIKLESPDVD